MKTLTLGLVVAALIAKTDSTQLAAWTGVILAASGVIKSLFFDPRTSRLAERRENADLRKEVDDLYRGKRDAEDREREAMRRLDTAERKLERAEERIAAITSELDRARAQISQLDTDARKWKLIADDLRKGRS